MQVTHVQDHVTSVTIAGTQAIDFGISDSPEFFNILSSTLYSDQKLAVIRETLCNAWDIHIESGCTDKAVEITLTDSKLIIRDFGIGIAPHMMGPIYGVYGGSTKVANGNVTGGFGLGCKAPFAYVDDFEVTSHHAGQKTIYRLSKSNAEVGGKPSIIPIITVPTDEQGIQVKIAIKAGDRGRFEELIRRIVQNGAMKMTLNGELLPRLPFDDMTNGFMLTKKKVLENFSPIVIRYGNVIYPIESAPEYAGEWADITKFLTRLASGIDYHARNNEWSLVLQAAPNTVSVTPSRESLSNQKHTLATIQTLMRAFLERRDKDLTAECYKLLDERIGMSWLELAPSELFLTKKRIPNMLVRERLSNRQTYHHGRQENRFADEANLTSFPQFVRQYATSAYPEFTDFRRKDIVRRVNALIQAGFGGVPGKKLLKAYRRAYLREEKGGLSRRVKRTFESTWFHKDLLWPLLKGMGEGDNTMKPNKMFVYSEKSSYSHDREKLEQATTWEPRGMEDMLPFARNIVILSFNKIDPADGDGDETALSRFWLGKTKHSLVYVCPRAPAKVQEAREFFAAKGCFLIDLTIEQERAYAKKAELAAANPNIVPNRPKRTGIPKLTEMGGVDGKTGMFVYHNRRMDTVPDIGRTQKPVFIVKDGRRNDYHEFDTPGYGWDKEGTGLFIELFGEGGALCVNQNQYDRYKAAGAIDWEDHLINKLVEEYSTNPAVREYLAFDSNRLDGTDRYGGLYGKLKWLDCVWADKDLTDYFGLVDNRSDREKKLMKLGQMVIDSYYFNGTEKKKPELVQLIKSIPLSQSLTGLMDRIKVAPLLAALDASVILTVLKNKATTKVGIKQRTTLRDTFLNCLEG